MAQTHGIRATELTKLAPVRTLTDLDWLVKEREILTGEPGREFVVLGADRPAYHVTLDTAGYQIQRVDDDSCAATPMHSTAPDLVRHTLGNALACGLLYTAALHQSA
ncbi:hypothetical protein [Rhizobacter sp. Root1221]|uniref:hypothetical protein n=1 Tax=Rhizobacter sp. Root1221 TaxID=1736433 RepID=UPI00070004B4|nr:hypothetical protein [Rhizobacter sp. Root1221]KQW02878.1 hypothetical protein ASC87_00545 [Rhizobacter sp. Root1221]